MTLRRQVVPVMLAMVLIAGCGDGDDDTAEPATTVAASADTTGSVATDDDPSDEATEVPVGGQDSEWCGLADRVDTELNAVESDPFSVFTAEGVDRLVTLLDDAVDAAPEEIRDAVTTTAGGFESLAGLLEDYDYDLLAVPTEELESTLDLPALEAADAEITAYNTDVCGVSTEPDPVTDSDPTSTVEVEIEGSATQGEDATQALVQNFVASLGITEDQATCLVDSLDFAEVGNDPATVDQSLIFEAFGECDIDLADLAG